MGGYRSGHNGADLKSVVSASTRRVGSNPTPPANKDTDSNLIKTVIVKWLRHQPSTLKLWVRFPLTKLSILLKDFISNYILQQFVVGSSPTLEVKF